MWVYDGEDWTEEGTSRNSTKPQQPMPPLDQFYPELQVIEVEIVPVPRPNQVPFPLP